MRAPALLALEDGTTFAGEAFGAVGVATGEACFNTSLAGYQEVLTDPSYHGQIVCMTAPHIGNTGVNAHDDQSRKPWVAGFVVRDVSRVDSSWRSEGSLEAYLSGHGIPGITEVDTRRLTRHLRDQGAMRSAIATNGTSADDLVEIARSSRSLEGLDLASEATTPEPYEWTEAHLAERAGSGYSAGAEPATATAVLLEPYRGERRRIAAIDLGLKRNILDLLVSAGFDITVLPARTSAQELLDGGYEGVFLSNGPGDPEPVSYATEMVREILGRLPVFGICLGHQILSLAVGCSTYKLPFGHRGGNHPVRRLGHDRIEITCQNHGFAVDESSIEGSRATLSHVNLNDGTVEGIEIPGVAYSVQYHPEAGPGPHDSRYLFGMFQELISTFEPQQLEVKA